MSLDRLSRRERSVLRELVVGATAVAGRGVDHHRLERLVAVAPMERLPAAAALHRVAGSVRRGLDGVAGVPDPVREQLAAIQQHSSLRHLVIAGALDRIGRAFDAAGLAWVVMKGPAVAVLLYPEVGERTYADLDLLVDARDFPRATQILEDLGFRHEMRNWALAEVMLAGQLGMTDEPVSVDLHWHLHYSHADRRPYRLDPAAMIARARTVDISGVTAPTLDPVDTLLTLAFHAARSDGHRLVWFKDIERSIAVEAPDLDELVRRCHSYRCGPPVGVILRRAARLVGAEIADEWVRELTPSTILAADSIVSAVRHPVQLHERPTAARMFTRSVRSSAAASVLEVPSRAMRKLRLRLDPPAENETDDPAEKASYLRAVVDSSGR